MWQRIWHLARKEFRQVLRDPRMRLVLVAPPIVQTIIFGYAVSLDVKLVKLGWIDFDRSAQSRLLKSFFEGSPRFHVTEVFETRHKPEALLEAGELDAVLEVPSGFSKKLAKGGTVQVQLIVDGVQANTAAIAAGYAQLVLSKFVSAQVEQQMRARLVMLTRKEGRPVKIALPSIDARIRILYNEPLLSKDYFVPGVVVNILAVVTVMLTTLSIVREKEQGTMEQLLVTPLRPYQLMLGKMLPFALVGFVQMMLLTLVAKLIFHVPLRGSFLLLLLMTLLFLLNTLSIGLLISTLSETQQQAVFTAFLVLMPVFLLSGFAFPIRNMPLPVQYLTYLNPLRYFMEVTRGIFLKGLSLDGLYFQTIALMLTGAGLFVAAILRMRRTLD